MQTILQALRSGNAKERLAVIADLTSIVGVSVASIVGGFFALAGTTNLSSEISQAIVFSLFCLAIAVLVLAVFLTFLTYLSGIQFKTPLVRPLLYISSWLLMIALTLIASLYYSSMIRFFFYRGG
jgi:hypothetical protein